MPNQETWYEKAGQEAFQNIVEVCFRPELTAPSLVRTIDAARRIATIYYPELNPSAVQPSDVCLESLYLELPQMEEQTVRDALLVVPRLMISLDPLIVSYSRRLLYRMGGSLPMLDLDGIQLLAEEKIEHTLDWNLNFSNLQHDGLAVFSENILHYAESILSNLASLTVRKFTSQVYTSDLIEVLTKDPTVCLPEDMIIQAEDFSETLGIIDSFPSHTRQILLDLANDTDGHKPKEVRQAKSLLWEKLMAASKLTHVHLGHDKRLSRETHGLTDELGFSVFQGLELGQVFWILAHLPPLEQTVMLIKLGYIHPNQHMQDAITEHNIPLTTASNRILSGKQLVKQLLIDMPNIPHLEESFVPTIDRARSFRLTNDKQASTASLFGKHRRIIYFASCLKGSAEFFESHLTPSQQDVLPLVLDGLPDAEIAQQVGIHPSNVAEHISNISSISRQLLHQPTQASVSQN